MTTKAENDREWRRVLDEHASRTMLSVIDHGAGVDWVGQVATARSGEIVDGRPTVEIQGPDGEWRRYLVRLTEAPKPMPPVDIEVLRAMRR